MVQNRLFFALASRSGFGLPISDPVARSSIVFCNSVFADRIVMAASRLLGAAAACVILLFFAAGLCTSYWSGCMKAATVICQQIFSILALVIFLLKILLKSVSKSFFFRSGVEIRSGFEPAISDPVARSSIVFCNSVSADRIVIAASRLLHAEAACVILLSFAAAVGHEVWSVKFKCGVRRAQFEVWSVKCEVWSVKEAVRSVKCGLWSVKCEWSVECEVRSVKCEVWSVKFGVRRKQWEVRSVKCGVWSAKWEVWS